MQRLSQPGVLYFGTPVVLISTMNEDGSANLAPISSIFWLGWRCMIGVAATSRTTENLLARGECVVNLPSDDLVEAVDRLALTTGSPRVPEGKARRGYVHCADKFARAGLTPAPSQFVAPPRVAECSAQLEARVAGRHRLAQGEWEGGAFCFELRVLGVHLDDTIRLDGEPDRVDPDRWRPIIMSFQKFFALGPRLAPATLAQIPERMYLTPDHATV